MSAAPSAVEVVDVHGADPARRGEQLARAAGERLVRTVETYEALFATCGLSSWRVRSLAEVARRSLADWAPDLAAETDALAVSAGLERWRLHALNARTELLAASGEVHRGECSTLARRGAGRHGRLSVQTWDWHRELAGFWNVVRHQDVALPFLTLTELGVLGKIGVNAAGVGLLFNILGHVSDAGVEGISVHALARRILDTAVDVGHARRIVQEAPLQASSCFTVVGVDDLACLEATPAGVRDVAPADSGNESWLVHTNHFLDSQLAAGDVRVGPEPDTLARHRLLTERAEQLEPAAGRAALMRTLCAHEEADGAPVCCHPPQGASLGEGWQTLATVVMDVVGRRMAVAAGGPCGDAPSSWVEVAPR